MVHLRIPVSLWRTTFRPARLAMLSIAIVLVVGWHPAHGQGNAPAGCNDVFAATSRGGALSPPSGGSCNPFRGGGRVKANVSRVVDGDTIVVDGGERVRYIGIDTPEIGDDPEAFGREATEVNRKLLEGGEVLLVKDVSERDRFGRLLRYVYADGILVNAEIVREGYARAVVFPPDNEHAGCFAALEAEAREARRGLWADWGYPDGVEG